MFCKGGRGLCIGACANCAVCHCHLRLDAHLGGFGQFRLRALEIDDPHTGEDCLAESSSHPVAGILEMPAGIADQLKPAAHACISVREIVFDPSESGLHVLLLILGLASARDCLRKCEATLGDEVVRLR